MSSVSSDLFSIDKSIGVAVKTDRLSKYSRNGSESDFFCSFLSYDIVNFGKPSSVPHKVVFRSSTRLGRSWLRMNRVFSGRNGLTSQFEADRVSKGFRDTLAEFDLWNKILIISEF